MLDFGYCDLMLLEPAFFSLSSSSELLLELLVEEETETLEEVLVPLPLRCELPPAPSF